LEALMAIGAESARRRLLLLHGPPGTGAELYALGAGVAPVMASEPVCAGGLYL
jgi:hypothetical protein